MGLSRGTRASYRIAQNTKYEDTSPELALDELCAKLGLQLGKGEEINAVQVNEFLPPTHYTLKVDRRIIDSDVVVEVDGIYHNSEIQRKKSKWRDEQLQKANLRVLHIEAELLICHGLGNTRKFWPHVAYALTTFLFSKQKVLYLPA